MTDPDTAWRTLMACLTPLPVEPCALDRCLHRTLAQPVVADRHIPAADRAAIDGYAVRADDVAPAPATLRIVAEVAAGSAARCRRTSKPIASASQHKHLRKSTASTPKFCRSGENNRQPESPRELVADAWVPEVVNGGALDWRR